MQPLPPDQAALAQAHRARQQQLAALADTSTAAQFAAVDPARPVESWTGRTAQAVQALLTAAQASAARGATDYVAAMLAMQGHEADPAGLVPAAAFAGIASDGRPLDTLLLQPVQEIRGFVDAGMSPAQAKEIGQRHLRRIVVTEVADAARVPTGVAIVADRTVHGYIRMLTPPSCARCVVLAGAFYRWNAGFQRHPGCDCVHIPAAVHVSAEATDPKRYFASLSPAEQDRIFTRAGAQAIRDGADLGRVVNARRGMYTAGGRKYTTEATTRRGTGRRVRMMPEQIYAEADRLGWSREQTIEELGRHGYILNVPVATHAAPPKAGSGGTPTEPPKPPAKVPAPEPEPLRGQAALDAAPSRLIPDPDWASGGIDRAHFEGPPGSGSPRALAEYQGLEYQQTNSELRGRLHWERGDPADVAREKAEIAQRVAEIDKTMAVSTLAADVEVFRVVKEGRQVFGDVWYGDVIDWNTDDLDAQDRQIERWEAGQRPDLTGLEWRELAYVSTSVSEDVVKAFGGRWPDVNSPLDGEPIIMAIRVPAGTSGIQISDLQDGQEGEILLQRGLALRVVADNGVDASGFRRLDLMVVPGG